MRKELPINERIRAREVRLIDQNGRNQGVVPLAKALAMAREAGLDLVEVDPSGNPPVCRILDYGKWKYQQEKKERESRRHHKGGELHEVRLRPNIGQHDLEFKIKIVARLLEGGDKVRVAVRFRRGREMDHPERGHEVLRKVREALDGIGVVEREPVMEGQFLSMIVAPGRKGAPKAAAASAKREVEKSLAQAEEV
ncbi:MAG TPA: translation initiation factor IF-3 [Dehalococcoidia bacterium]|nr:translation initiation factor IF-3 [Dehalococcoidia bacterium]